jgi:hypothetical protein
MTTSHTLQHMGVGLVGLALLTSGCATATDVRGSARVGSAGPALLVSGPIEILHVNVDQKTTAKFSRVAGNSAGTSGDCRTAAPLPWNGETDLTLQAGESVCVEVGHATRVSWHGRTLAPAPAQTAQVHASLP